MNWVKKCKLPVVKAVKYNNCPCLNINDLWLTLYLISNMAQNQQVNIDILDEIPDKYSTDWPPFSEEEFIRSTAKYNNLSVVATTYHNDK